MNYLLRSREVSRKKNLILFGIPGIFLALIILLQFFAPHFLSGTLHQIGKPFFFIRKGVVNGGEKFFGYFRFKSNLLEENNALKQSLQELEGSLLQFNLLVKENEELKAELGRENDQKEILAYVLQGPGFSPYDTFILDAGSREGVKEGDRVMLGGNVIVGTIREVNEHTSKARGFSSEGEELLVQVPPNDLLVKAFGKGGGSFSIKLPKDVPIQKGTLISLPGIQGEVVGIVEGIESGATHSENNVLVRSVFNIYQIDKVYIKIQ